MTVPAPPPPPPSLYGDAKPRAGKGRTVAVAALIAAVVTALIMATTFLLISKNVSTALDESATELQANLTEAGNAKASLEQSLVSAGVDVTRLIQDGSQSGASATVETTASGEPKEDQVLQVSPAAISSAEAKLDSLSSQIESGEALLARTQAGGESKRPLLREVQTHNEILTNVTATAVTAASNLDEAVADAILDAAQSRYAIVHAELVGEVEAAEALLTESEGKVGDGAARDALSASINAAKQLLETDLGSTPGSSQSGEASVTADQYELQSDALAAMVSELQTGRSAVDEAVAAKAEADRVAAEEAEAARVAAEQQATSEVPERLPGGGCRWPVGDPMTDWTPVWKVQGWCTEDEFWDAVGCARGWYPGCDE